MTLSELQKAGKARLQRAEIEDAAFEADCLLESATGYSRSQCLVRGAEAVSERVTTRFFSQIARRIQGEPLQYILGKWSFYGRSGCIGLTVAKEVPECTVYLFEKYDAAFSYLQKNAEALYVPNAHLIKADILADTPPDGVQADLLLSNPPYIPKRELPELQKEVLREPSTALDGGADGLDFYRVIQKRWMPFVNADGTLLFECGDGQGSEIATLFESAKAAKVRLTDSYRL